MQQRIIGWHCTSRAGGDVHQVRHAEQCLHRNLLSACTATRAHVSLHVHTGLDRSALVNHFYVRSPCELGICDCYSQGCSRDLRSQGLSIAPFGSPGTSSLHHYLALIGGAAQDSCVFGALPLSKQASKQAKVDDAHAYPIKSNATTPQKRHECMPLLCFSIAWLDKVCYFLLGY